MKARVVRTQCVRPPAIGSGREPQCCVLAIKDTTVNMGLTSWVRACVCMFSMHCMVCHHTCMFKVPHIRRRVQANRIADLGARKQHHCGSGLTAPEHRRSLNRNAQDKSLRQPTETYMQLETQQQALQIAPAQGCCGRCTRPAASRGAATRLRLACRHHA